MSEDLKSCPFCGCEARVFHETCGTWIVGCDDDNCLGFIGLGWDYDTECEAADAWNRRVERTCHQVIDGETATCSECGERMDSFGLHCKHCGAKVVVE